MTNNAELDKADAVVKQVLLEWIELAKPDDLAFLELQIDQITRQIVGCFYPRK